MSPLGLLFLLGLAQGTIMYENIIFQKLNDITTTRSKWLVTFVIDLKPYDQFIGKCRYNINQVAMMIRQLLSRYHSNQSTGILSMYTKLDEEIIRLNATLNDLVDNFSEYSRLRTRPKRSLLPFVGSALSFLFGTVSEADLSTIKTNIRRLAENQAGIAHVIHEGLSILNTTRMQVSENRNAINEVVNDLGIIEQEIANVSGTLSNQIARLEWATKTYLQIELAIENIRSMVQTFLAYLEHLQLQINMLALGHLSPSTITPSQLLALLNDIKAHLPSKFRLANDPVGNLWGFYKTLLCTTVLFDDKILVITSIPLLDVNGQFGIYQAHNLPVPLIMNGISTKPNGINNMVAEYRLETEVIAVNAQRTKYALLKPSEVQTCTKPLTGYCHIQSPIYPINLSHLCVISLFMKDETKVRQTCHTEVRPNAILPMAEYLTAGRWVLTTTKRLDLVVVCNNNNLFSYTVAVLPPLGIIKLNASCSASNDHLTLLPYYHNESQYEFEDNLIQSVHTPNVSNMLLWKPFMKTAIKLNLTRLPDKLKGIKNIPMNHLIDQLNDLQTMIPDDETPGWKYVLGVALIIVGILVGMFLYVRYIRPWLAKRGKSRRNVCAATSFEMAPVDTGSAVHAYRGTLPSAPLLRRRDHDPAEVEPTPAIRSIYPTLDTATIGHREVN
ncbi:uncharacterized protein [Haliotis cracherodii]|uniref:uncharacterized protein n=1 Tax=Haliotis cracherodii TaxID=6455 RepID=UPI0039EC9BC5